MTEWTTSDAALHQRVQSVVDTIDVRHFRYPVRWVLTAKGIAPVTVTLIASVLSKDTGHSVDAIMHSHVGHLMAASDDEIAAFLWRTFTTFLDHESRECFYRGGVRVYDPHARDYYLRFNDRADP